MICLLHCRVVILLGSLYYSTYRSIISMSMSSRLNEQKQGSGNTHRKEYLGFSCILIGVHGITVEIARARFSEGQFNFGMHIICCSEFSGTGDSSRSRKGQIGLGTGLACHMSFQWCLGYDSGVIAVGTGIGRLDPKNVGCTLAWDSSCIRGQLAGYCQSA